MDFQTGLQKYVDDGTRLVVCRILGNWKPGELSEYNCGSVNLKITPDGHAHGVIYKNGVPKFYDWKMEVNR